MLDENLLIPLAFFGFLAFTIIGLARIISEGRTRRRLIDAGGSAEVAHALAGNQDEHGLYGALKWGIVTVGVGLAFVIVQFLPYGADDPIMFGVVLLFLGGGLLTYYATVRRLANRAEARRAATA